MLGCLEIARAKLNEGGAPFLVPSKLSLEITKVWFAESPTRG
jgi:hypothetical protein